MVQWKVVVKLLLLHIQEENQMLNLLQHTMILKMKHHPHLMNLCMGKSKKLGERLKDVEIFLRMCAKYYLALVGSLVTICL